MASDPNAGRVDITGKLLSAPATPASGQAAGGGPVHIDTPTPGSGGGDTDSTGKLVASSTPAVPANQGSKSAAPSIGGSSGAAPVPGSYGPDSAYATAEKNQLPTAPESEEDFFSKVYSQIAPVIDSINSSETAAETAAYAAGSQEQTDLNASEGSRGLGGSSEAARMSGKVSLDTAGAIAAARQAQTTALSNATQFITGQAYTEFKDAQTRGDTIDATYAQNMQATALATVKGIAESGITSAADLQAKNPQAYTSLLQYYNNDPVALNSALVMNQPQNKIQQSWIQGSTYYQLVTDPITGQPKVQSLDTGVNIPSTWTPNKVGTTTLLMQDPNNPANSVTYTTNPFTGEVTASGSGTGVDIATEYNQAHPTDSGNSDNSTGTGSGAIAISQTLGVDPTQPLGDVVANSGIGAVVAAIIKNEGGSPAGVVNNPGNVKFTGAAGQTDSGVAASDGGTFASYATPDQGQKAIADLVTSAASGQNSAYGANPTLGSFAGTYTNTGNPQGGNGLDSGQYGLLSTVPGFDPSTPGVDQTAYNYLNEYLSGQTPSAASVGISTRTGSGAEFNTIAARARDVYYKATGQPLPNQTELKGNLKLIVGNQALKNKLQVQSSTIGANFGLNLANLNENNVNQGAPIANGILDGVLNALGDPDVAQYLAQNATITNEVGSLLALKNASGTTVADKLESSGLLPANSSAAQQTKIYKTLMQEAMNADTAVQLANIKLYQDTDPLNVDPGNPLNGPITMQDLSTGETRTFDRGTLKASDIEDALNNGYVMTQ